MKKILIFLFLVYSYSFSAECLTSSFINFYYSSNCDGRSPSEYSHGKCVNTTVAGSSSSSRMYVLIPTGSYTCSYDSTEKQLLPNGILEIDYNTKEQNFYPNPDPLGGPTCREGFVKDGQYYNCNPNTNEAELVPNSDGYETDEDGNVYPKCNDGFEGSSSLVIGGNGSSGYTSQSCVQQSNTDSPGTGDNGSFPDAPTTSVGADGSTSWTWGDGTVQTLSPNGTLTTYYPDGTNSVKQVGNDYTPTGGGSSSGGGIGGGGFTGPGTNGNTTNETDTPPTNNNPIDNTPVANSCNDSNLTLQEKLLCEMNAGMKKLNSETSPENSLNNLIKEMNKDNNTNATAINTNIKETNKILTDTKALNENQLSELKNVTKELKKLNATSGTSTSTITQPITDNFTPAENDTGGLGSSFESDKNLIDSFTGVYTDFKNNLLGHKDTLDNLITNTATTINSGIGLSLSTTEIINCPLNYNLDMTHTIGKNIAFNIDICEVTSKTKPYLYPIFLIIFTVGSVFFAFRFIGVLL